MNDLDEEEASCFITSSLQCLCNRTNMMPVKKETPCSPRGPGGRQRLPFWKIQPFVTAYSLYIFAQFEIPINNVIIICIVTF